MTNPPTTALTRRVAEQMAAGLGLVHRETLKRWVVLDWNIIVCGHVMTMRIVRLRGWLPFRLVYDVDDSHFDEYDLVPLKEVAAGSVGTSAQASTVPHPILGTCADVPRVSSEGGAG